MLHCELRQCNIVAMFHDAGASHVGCNACEHIRSGNVVKDLIFISLVSSVVRVARRTDTSSSSSSVLNESSCWSFFPYAAREYLAAVAYRVTKRSQCNDLGLSLCGKIPFFLVSKRMLCNNRHYRKRCPCFRSPKNVSEVQLQDSGRFMCPGNEYTSFVSVDGRANFCWTKRILRSLFEQRPQSVWKKVSGSD